MKGFQIQQKGERRISAALRIMLVVVLLAVQIGFVVAISYFMQEYLALAYGVVQVGALFLAVLAVVPTLLAASAGVSIAFGASSLLIAVSVALETTRQLESQMLMRHYRGFLK